MFAMSFHRSHLTVLSQLSHEQNAEHYKGKKDSGKQNDLPKWNTAQEQVPLLSTFASRTNCIHFHVLYQGQLRNEVLQLMCFPINSIVTTNNVKLPRKWPKTPKVVLKKKVTTLNHFKYQFLLQKIINNFSVYEAKLYHINPIGYFGILLKNKQHKFLSCLSAFPWKQSTEIQHSDPRASK